MKKKYNFDELDVTNDRIAEIIEQYIHSKRDRALLKDVFIDGLPYAEVAEKYYITVEAVKKIVYKQGDKILLKLL